MAAAAVRIVRMPIGRSALSAFPHTATQTPRVACILLRTHNLSTRRPYSTTKPDSDGDIKSKIASTVQSPPPSSADSAPESLLKNLPSRLEERRSELSKRFSRTMDDLQTAVFTAGRRLNDLTGYSDIESLKRAIEEQERHVSQCRMKVKEAKAAYGEAINKRSASQREVNELLQRKHAWSPSDLERFTSLYRSDHANEQEEVAAQDRLARAEKEVEEAQDRLSTSILARYHEEQIWSDKIRRASTWGTWGLMGFNVLLFIVVQLGLEPWKRKRLVGGFEEKVREVIQEENMRNALLNMHLEASATPSPPAVQVEEPAVVEKVVEPQKQQEEIVEQTRVEEKVAEAEVEPEVVQVVTEEKSLLARLIGEKTEIKEAVTSLVSSETVSLKKVEVTSIAVGSAAAGAAVAVASFLLNR